MKYHARSSAFDGVQEQSFAIAQKESEKQEKQLMIRTMDEPQGKRPVLKPKFTARLEPKGNKIFKPIGRVLSQRLSNTFKSSDVILPSKDAGPRFPSKPEAQATFTLRASASAKDIKQKEFYGDYVAPTPQSKDEPINTMGQLSAKAKTHQFLSSAIFAGHEYKTQAETVSETTDAPKVQETKEDPKDQAWDNVKQTQAKKIQSNFSNIFGPQKYTAPLAALSEAVEKAVEHRGKRPQKAGNEGRQFPESDIARRHADNRSVLDRQTWEAPAPQVEKQDPAPAREPLGAIQVKRFKLDNIPRGVSEEDLRLLYPAAGAHAIRIDTNHRSEDKDSGYLSIRCAKDYDADKLLTSLQDLGIKATQAPHKANGTKACYTELAKTDWKDFNNTYTARKTPTVPQKSICTDRTHESLGQWLGMKKRMEYAAIKPVLRRNKK